MCCAGFKCILGAFALQSGPAFITPKPIPSACGGPGIAEDAGPPVSTGREQEPGDLQGAQTPGARTPVSVRRCGVTLLTDANRAEGSWSLGFMPHACLVLLDGLFGLVEDVEQSPKRSLGFYVQAVGTPMITT